MDPSGILLVGGAPTRGGGAPEILVVNEDADLRLGLCRALGVFDVPLIEARSGAEALRRIGPATAVVLVDADLPDATGFEICAELKSRGRTGMPSVLIRAPSVLDPDLHARVAACGADGVVRRGADPLELATAVRGLLRAHAAEQKARRIEEEALRRDALHQELLAIAGHDLRTPLQVSLLATAALNRLDLPPQTQPHLDRIERSTHRAVRLVNDLLDVSIAQQGGIPIRPVWMDLGEVVRETARELQAANPGRTLEICATGEFPGVWDPDRIAQVVSNLGHNALCYGAPDVPVRISVEARSEGMAVTVWNGGPAIDPRDVPGLFLAFRRGPHFGRNGRGLGIGLYIVERIVHAHGGEVSVRSSAELGTEFTVLLPRVRSAEA